MIRNGGVTFTEIRIISNGINISKHRYSAASGEIDTEKVNEQFKKGATVKLKAIERCSTELINLHTILINTFKARVHINSYLSSQNGFGYDIHRDDHEIFIIQIEGSKLWELYDDTSLSNNLSILELKPVQTITMNAGDVLYIPKGIPHKARCADPFSLHLTLGVYESSYHDWLNWLIYNKLDHKTIDEPFYKNQKGIDLSFLSEQLKKNIENTCLLEEFEKHIIIKNTIKPLTF